MPVGAIEDIHAGKVSADRRGSAKRKLLELVAGDDGHGPSALLHVGDPARRLPRHGGDDAPLRHQEAEVAKAVGAFDADKALQVVDARHRIRLWDVILASDEFEPAPLRAEQW